MNSTNLYKARNFESGVLFQTMRLKARLRQSDIAAMVGVGVNTVQFWESGTTYPKVETFKKLLEVYLRFELFSHGQELAEAEELWERVRQEAPRLNALFDQQWFQIRLATIAHSQQLKANLRNVVPHNLPERLTSFVGRKKELAVLSGWLQPGSTRPAVRLVTLNGTGGCGKTSLAREVSREVLASYPQGVWLVELAPSSKPSGVIQTLATTLNLKERAGTTLLATITDYLREKQVLLVMDNCEHLLDECARVVERLLQDCPQLVVLATSREKLKVSGETVFRVPSLSVPPVPASSTRKNWTSKNLPSAEELMEYEAVQLFVERGRNASPHFALNEQNKAEVVKLCRRLDGIPLAIELAAARLRVLSIFELSERLANRFRLLKSSSDRTILSRHLTLRATIDWSYDLLNLQERLLFRRLAVFSGGFSLAASQEICTGTGLVMEEMLDLLYELVNKSLVIVEEEKEESLVESQLEAPRRPLRFRLLETLREYGWEQLATIDQSKVSDPDEADAIQDRHLTFFTKYAEQMAPKLIGPEAQTGLEELEIDYDNLRGALNWCLPNVAEAENKIRLKTRTEQGLSMGTSLFQFWYVRSYFKEGREFLEKLKTQAELLKLEPTVELIRVVSGAGKLAEEQADFRQATGLLEESLKLARQIEDKKGIAYSMTNLGHLVYREGDYQAAYNHFQQSLEIAREIDDMPDISHSLSQLGNMAHRQGDYRLARGYYQECLAIRREFEEKHTLSAVLSNLGNIDFLEGNYQGAQSYYQEALNTAREIGDQSGMANGLSHLAIAVASQEIYEPALDYFQQSLEIFREIGDRHSVAFTLNNLANMASSQGNYQLASNYLQESLEIAKKIGDTKEVSNALNNLGTGAVLQEDYQLADRYYRESIAIRLELGDKRGIGETLTGYCALPLQQAKQSSLLDSAKLERACRLAGAATGLFEAINAEFGEPEKSIYQKTVDILRQEMGEEAFNTIFAIGRTMTMEEAAAYTLAEA